MNRPAPSSSSADPQADGRDGRVVGDNDDNPLESLGKAVVAPVEGADEDAPAAGDRDAEPVDDGHGRAFVDLTRTHAQGRKGASEDGASTVPKARGRAL
jgi:hypothetical protein